MQTVLGGNGFIGRNLATCLRSEGQEVFVPLRDDPGIFRRRLGHVFYCAGVTGDFRTRPFDTFRAHAGLLAEVLERADFESLVYLSSTRVYSRCAQGTEETMININPSDPDDVYNLSKLAGESLCFSSGREGVKVVRLSNVAGIVPEPVNFLPALIQQALAGHILLQSSLDSARDYILLTDVIALLPMIANGGGHTLYNVASGRNVTNREIVDHLKDLTGCRVSVANDAAVRIFPPITTERLCSDFNFKPGSILDALPGLIDGYADLTRAKAGR